MLKRARSQAPNLHPYYDLEDALQRYYQRRRWFVATLVVWLVGMVWAIHDPPVQFTSWLQAGITLGLGGLVALVGLLIINLTTENLKFADEDLEQRLLKQCITLLQPYLEEGVTLDSIATLAERRSVRVQLRVIVPGLLVTGFVAVAVVNAVPAHLFAILVLLTAVGTFALLLELAKAQAAGIIQDAIEIVRYAQYRRSQQDHKHAHQLLEALVLSQDGKELIR
jgi:hypothetical protein